MYRGSSAIRSLATAVFMTWFEISEAAVRPDLALQLFAGDDWLRALKQQNQHHEGLVLMRNLVPTFRSSPGTKSSIRVIPLFSFGHCAIFCWQPRGQTSTDDKGKIA